MLKQGTTHFIHTGFSAASCGASRRFQQTAPLSAIFMNDPKVPTPCGVLVLECASKRYFVT
jgi:hypothetical protein